MYIYAMSYLNNGFVENDDDRHLLSVAFKNVTMVLRKAIRVGIQEIDVMNTKGYRNKVQELNGWVQGLKEQLDKISQDIIRAAEVMAETAIDKKNFSSILFWMMTIGDYKRQLIEAQDDSGNCDDLAAKSEQAYSEAIQRVDGVQKIANPQFVILEQNESTKKKTALKKMKNKRFDSRVTTPQKAYISKADPVKLATIMNYSVLL